MENPENKTITAVLLALRTPDINPRLHEYSLQELTMLADTAQIGILDIITQNKSRPEAGTYFGKGKLVEIAGRISELKPDVVIVDDEITPSQQKNMELVLRTESSSDRLKVIDRTELILLIFAQRAHTREAQLQVELASLEYELPRLTRMWQHLERQVAKIGTRGPGETQIEMDRRRIRNKVSFLKQKIEEIQSFREVQRKQRKKEGIPVAAIIGYTNAGKSTLLNTLTDSEVLAENKLFATLDTTTRRLKLSGNQELLLIDTVGFIHKLPHSLVTSFRATLEEAREADFFIHVVDINAPDPLFMIDSVYTVIEELHMENKPVITLFNKIDLSYDEKQLASLRKKFYPSAAVSLKNRENIDDIFFLIEELLGSYRRTLSLFIPFSQMQLIDFLHQKSTIIHEQYDSGGVYLELEIPRQYLYKVQDFIVQPGDRPA